MLSTLFYFKPYDARGVFQIFKTNDVSYNLNNLQKKYSNELKNYLNSISKDKRFFRIYLSEKVFKDINNRRNLYYKKMTFIHQKTLLNTS